MDIAEHARQLNKFEHLTVACFLRTVDIVMLINEQSLDSVSFVNLKLF